MKIKFIWKENNFLRFTIDDCEITFATILDYPKYDYLLKLFNFFKNNFKGNTYPILGDKYLTIFEVDWYEFWKNKT